MAKYLLWIFSGFFFLTSPGISEAQVISSLVIQHSQPGINNNIEVIAKVGIPYIPGRVINNYMWQSNDTVFLTSCYYSSQQATPILVTDTFQIGTLNPGSYKLYFKAFLSNTWSHCDSSSFTTRTQGFMVSNPLGIKPNLQEPVLLIYPNPAKDFIFVKNQNSQSVIIRDLTGKILQIKNFQPEQDLKLDLSAIYKGMYFMEVISSEGKTQTQKFLKN